MPAYGQHSLADLMPSLLAVFGLPGFSDELGLTAALDGVRRVIVLLIDGLGEHNLRAHPGLAPVLTAMASPCGPIDASSPSTTPVSLASLATGLPPGQHGIVGFTVAVPGSQRLLTHIEWRADPDPRRWQPAPTAFETMAAAGISVTVGGPARFIGSGLSEAIYRGASPRPVISPGDLVSRALVAAGEGDRSLAYTYQGELDMTGHVRGCSSGAWKFQLAQVDSMVGSILAELATDTALIVTADHGMLDVANENKIDLDAIEDEPGADAATELAAGVRLVAGEPRARYVHTEPGAAADVLATWSSILGSRAWVLSREEAISVGLYGPVVLAAHAQRIGDVTAWASGHHAMTASVREPGAHALIGYHGSLTPEELAVPLRIGRR